MDKNNDMARSPGTQTIYKLSAFFGTAITLVVPFVSWTHITGLEPRAVQAFEQHILAELDMQSLNKQLGSIEYAIDQSKVGSEMAVNYSPAELATLAGEVESLRGQLEQRSLALGRLDREKNSIIAEIKLTVAATIVILAVGMVFAIFGFVAWYFHIQILEDRRATPRE
jgi:hypothetical protein